MQQLLRLPLALLRRRPLRALTFSTAAPSRAAAAVASTAAAPPSAGAGAGAVAGAGAADADAFPGVRGGSGAEGGEPAPALMVAMYTCKVCETRSARRISRAAYDRGSVLLRCPGCKALHVLADHLGYFDDAAVDAAALLERRGEVVRRGALHGGGGAVVAGGADAHVVELLTADDMLVLASASKGVRLSDKQEMPVVNMGR